MIRAVSAIVWSKYTPTGSGVMMSCTLLFMGPSCSIRRPLRYRLRLRVNA
jgi:hypothetical protein